ncbi:MAG: DEAD/DEAH box helicase [Chthoniobacteraceae bacterium]
MSSLLQSLTIPDFWQQKAVRALREGKDVVVHAPTGAGKTYVFELFHQNLKGQAVFTVPTRALANDKLAEWQSRGWDVGISTGDVAHRLDAKVVVATLETQKGRFLQRKGPSLLVIDEYQMIADPIRGVNYELAIALAPPCTQLLLLSGSVANPQDVVQWLQRIGRDALLVAHEERPVPLEEIDLQRLPDRAASNIRGWWPRQIANALRSDLGPILLFAPRRNAAEELAQQLAAALPSTDSLRLTPEQEQLAGTRLSKLLKQRVAYHHSGLSYAQRASVVEPLAKAGQLRVVVATMGLAAGINFSMRSVGITGTAYRAGHFEKQVLPDELLQMYGRAGRRGLDEVGYALVTPQPPRLHDARPRQLRRSPIVDWPTLIAVMQGAILEKREPFEAALELNERLFTAQKIPLGIEHSFRTGAMPCGLWVDMERARYARRGTAEMLNGSRKWETLPAQQEFTLGEAWSWEASSPPRAQEDGRTPETDPARGRWRKALSIAGTLGTAGAGNIVRLQTGPETEYGRELVIGTRQANGTLALSPSLRKTLGILRIDLEGLEEKVLRRLPDLTGGGQIREIFPRGEQLVARLSYGGKKATGWIDSDGRALLNPPQRRELPLPCRGLEFRDSAAEANTPPGASCRELPWCLGVEITQSPAHAWRRLGLIEPGGRPTRRGIIFSFFQHGEGLAVAAALEDPSYTMDELVFDLANLRAGPRFSDMDSPYSGRLAILCQQKYERADLPGYLEHGVPSDYGAGAAEAVREVIVAGTPRQKLLTEALRLGDLERAIIEWRSLLRHIVHAPDYDWDRWRALKAEAAAHLGE